MKRKASKQAQEQKEWNYKLLRRYLEQVRILITANQLVHAEAYLKQAQWKLKEIIREG